MSTVVLAVLFYGVAPDGVLLPLCLLFPVAIIWLRRRHGHKHDTFLKMDVLAQRSLLRQWSTGVKVCAAVTFLVFCISCDSVLVALVIAVTMSAVTLIAARIHLDRYISMLLIPITFVVLSGLVILVEISPDPLGLLDIPVFSRYICITPESQRAAGLVMAKALGALCCLYGLGMSTPAYEITAYLRGMHVPAIVVELMALIYRYIFLLLDALSNMTTAAHSRLGYGSIGSSWRSFAGIGSNLFSRAFGKASRSFDAMEARCYQGEIRFLERRKPLKKVHILAVSAMAGFYLAVFLVERGLK